MMEQSSLENTDLRRRWELAWLPDSMSVPCHLVRGSHSSQANVRPHRDDCLLSLCVPVRILWLQGTETQLKLA